MNLALEKWPTSALHKLTARCAGRILEHYTGPKRDFLDATLEAIENSPETLALQTTRSSLNQIIKGLKAKHGQAKTPENALNAYAAYTVFFAFRALTAKAPHEEAQSALETALLGAKEIGQEENLRRLFEEDAEALNS